MRVEWAPFIGIGIALGAVVWRGSWLLARKAEKAELEELDRRKLDRDDCFKREREVREERSEIWKEIGANRVAIGDSAKEFAEVKGTLNAYIEVIKVHIEAFNKANGRGLSK